MSLHLPERVSDLRDLDHDDHRMLYVPEEDGDGFRLSHPALAQFEDFLATVAEIEADRTAQLAEIRRQGELTDKRLRQLAVAGAVRDALAKAGANRLLLDAAAALFVVQNPVRVEGHDTDTPRVLLDDPSSAASVSFAVEAWLHSPAGKPYRGSRTVAPGDGHFARQLRAAAMQEH